MIDTILCNKKEFLKVYRKHQFELFGFDFMIDEDFRVWLIECNTNPYLGIPNSFIADILPKMLNDMLKITLNGLFVKKKGKDGQSRS